LRTVAIIPARAARTAQTSAVSVPQVRRNCLTLWVFRTAASGWAIREEGTERHVTCPSRQEALAIARESGRAAGSYHLYAELQDGRFLEEFLNLSGR
jgi:hypothetical protein